MRRQAWKWLLLGGALTFLVLFGMEMSTSGIEQIYGPLDGQASSYGAREEGASERSGGARYESETERRIAELEKELAEIRKLAYGEETADMQDNPRLPGVPYEADRPTVNKLADSTSGLLQSASSKGIRFVVSLFDGFME